MGRGKMLYEVRREKGTREEEKRVRDAFWRRMTAGIGEQIESANGQKPRG